MIPCKCRNWSIVPLVFASMMGAARIASAQNDPSAQFSPVNNPNPVPNGVWSYGYENFPLPNPFNLLTLPGPVATTPTFIDAWRAPAFGEVGVYHNGSAVNQNFVGPGDNAFYQPGELGMHPGPNDQYGVVQFTVPAAGIYQIHGVFEGLDVAGTNTDVRLLKNNITVAVGNVIGFGPGSDVPLAVGPVFLNPGDTLAYAVGGNPINGSTGLLNARVDAVVPEPSTFVLCGLGLIGLLVSAVRRKRTKRGTVG
jgi:PEP-CTERM motif